MRPRNGHPAELAASAASTRTSFAWVVRVAGLLVSFCCVGCRDLLEGFLLVAAVASLTKIFAPVLLMLACAHLLCAAGLHRPPYLAKAFGWLATGWFLFSVLGLVAVFWLQSELTGVPRLELFLILPASTLAVGYLAAHTSSRLAALNAVKENADQVAQRARKSDAEDEAMPAAPVGALLRLSNVVVPLAPLAAIWVILRWLDKR